MRRFAFLAAVAVLAAAVRPAGALAASPPPGTLAIAAAGDVCLTGKRFMKPPYAANAYPFASSSALFRDADLALVNLECVLSTSTARMDKKFTFEGSPAYARALANAGIDVVSLANNHAADFGRVSLLHTLRALDRAGVAHAGGGRDVRQAYAPSFLTVKGRRIAVLAATDVIPAGFAATERLPGVAPARPLSRLASAVRAARRSSDLVIVFVHWGVERTTSPNARQRAIAHALVNAGADVVLGSHPHVWQPVEVYRGRFIAYSLGNFVFFPGNHSGRFTGVLTLVATGNELTVRIVPYFIGSNGMPVRVSPSSAAGRFVGSVLRRSTVRFAVRDGAFEARARLGRPLVAGASGVPLAVLRARDARIGVPFSLARRLD